MKRSEYKQGAKVLTNWERSLIPAPSKAKPVNANAAALALSNRNKSWAKRWLRENRNVF